MVCFLTQFNLLMHNLFYVILNGKICYRSKLASLCINTYMAFFLKKHFLTFTCSNHLNFHNSIKSCFILIGNLV